MPIHVAILKREYLRMILDGRKAVESRLSKVNCPPHGLVSPGERLFFKASAGPFMATALAAKVEDHDDLTPDKIQALRDRWNPAVCGDDAYWQLKQHARFATFIRLQNVEVLEAGPVYKPQNMRAWYALPDTHNPLRDIALTAAALRNHYLLLPGVSPEARGRSWTLHLPDGERIETEFADRGNMLRWRGWGRYFDAFAMKPGDTVRLIAERPGHYAIRFIPKPTTI